MKIKSITPAGRSDVFNMEVEVTHDFAVGKAGAIVHNCYDEWRYMCMSRPIAPRDPVVPQQIDDSVWRYSESEIWTPPAENPFNL